MSKRNSKLLVDNMLNSAYRIIDYTKNVSFEQFINDSKTSNAVIRNFEITGEASNRLPEDFKNNSNSIDWERIRGFRNRVVHEYFGIDYSVVWQL